jgi:hypothetical protein
MDAVHVLLRHLRVRILYSSVSPGLLWQLAQVLGRLSLKTGDRWSLTGRMSWAPWQSAQLAAPDAPRAWLMPWMLVVNLGFVGVTIGALRRRERALVHQFGDGVAIDTVSAP